MVQVLLVQGVRPAGLLVHEKREVPLGLVCERKPVQERKALRLLAQRGVAFDVEQVALLVLVVLLEQPHAVRVGDGCVSVLQIDEMDVLVPSLAHVPDLPLPESRANRRTQVVFEQSLEHAARAIRALEKRRGVAEDHSASLIDHGQVVLERQEQVLVLVEVLTLQMVFDDFFVGGRANDVDRNGIFWQLDSLLALGLELDDGGLAVLPVISALRLTWSMLAHSCLTRVM